MPTMNLLLPVLMILLAGKAMAEEDVPPRGASVDPEIFASVAEALARGCDWLDPHYCMYPFPNDHFTITTEDPRYAALQETDPLHGSNGRRVHFNPLAMPRNRAGRALDPTEWNRNDGFSPGQMIQARIPGLSLRADVYRDSGDVVPRLTRMQHALAEDSIVSVFQVVELPRGTDRAAPPGRGPKKEKKEKNKPEKPKSGLVRHLVFAEIDQNLTKAGQCGAGRPAEAIASLLGGDAFADALAMVRRSCESTAFNQPADPSADPGPALLIRPATNFEEGGRYVVALRKLRDDNGNLLEATPQFRVYRDNLASDIPAVEARRPHFEEIFSLLRKAGIKRQELYLAWDFTVISRDNLTGRLGHMIGESVAWMDAELASPQPGLPASTPLDPATSAVQENAVNLLQAGVGAHAGAWRITSVTDDPADARVRRTVKGVIKLPSFLTSPGGITGTRMYFDPTDRDGLPDRVGGEALLEAAFTCRIPQGATSATPARPSLYGHGLLGGRGEVESSHVQQMGRDGRIMFCGLDWIGMSTQDVPQAAAILLDFSHFPLLADRTQQGILNFIMMGYLLGQQNGIVTDPAFHDENGPLFSPREVFYDGNSQGGIMGGAVVAMSPNVHRGVLGVPGMNYSTLLRRSVDFDGYGAIMYSSYPTSLDQSFLLSMVQMLWDRGESNGYFNTLASKPEKAVLLHVGYGDHQVADIAADAMARTAGAKVYAPVSLGGEVTSAVAADRHDHEIPYYGIERFTAEELDGENTGQAWRGSALVVWDSGPAEWQPADAKQGTERTPACNMTLPKEGGGDDPHEAPRRATQARQQKALFLDYDGRFVNTCKTAAGAARACIANGGAAFTEWAYNGGVADAYESPCQDP